MQQKLYNVCFPKFFGVANTIFFSPFVQLFLSFSLQQEEDTPPPTPQNKQTKVPPETKPKPVTPPPVTAPPAVGEDDDDSDKIMAELQVRSASTHDTHTSTQTVIRTPKREPFFCPLVPTSRPSL